MGQVITLIPSHKQYVNPLSGWTKIDPHNTKNP
jgi:hypothetical protein